MATGMIKATNEFEHWLETRTGFEGLTRPAKLSDFLADKSLGEGAYAKVIKVQSRASGKFYAMKVIAKKKIENYQMKDQLKNEVNIMSKLFHPNIIQLHTIFEDKKNIYFVIELADEKHMYARLQEVGRFEEKVAVKVDRDDRIVCLRRVQSGGISPQTKSSNHSQRPKIRKHPHVWRKPQNHRLWMVELERQSATHVLWHARILGP